ncbi:TetR/AcrR family transcriptional regulator [Kitasatospora kifunensis]|uniref:AcrR family transcriptional regulator n=1 Tax=Kitasatospora kifunensis TaxID=58351 RepID=A0A7W7QYQ0_KITKI|nr:TetR/AcrR family transcriptional regulator [Kitasatospora kifunensis]MBB4921979.1 AcrR family transcriptional regulator [Kitasatospora kifunensis]
MRVRDESADRSVAATARRSQIVAATIETIAELGYAQASFARIAERAGLSSTRLISYHFAGKRELIEQVVSEVYTEIGEFMAARLAGRTGGRELLLGYIEGYLEFIAGHRVQMKALLGIFLAGALDYDPESTELVVLDPIERILRHGQESGEFRDFDPQVVAASVRRSVDGIPLLLEAHPELDLGACAAELCTLFDLATRKDQGRTEI